LDIHLAMINDGRPKATAHQNWLARHPRLQVCFTPNLAC
jgi:hypothetical protein